MKKLIYIIIVIALWGCKDDEILEQPAVSFYPSITITAAEGGNTTFDIPIETSGTVDGGGSVFIELVNGEDLVTVPAAVGGVVELAFADGTSSTSMSVKAGNDNRGGDYTAQLVMRSVSGGIRSIANGVFTVFVLDNDREVIFADDFESNNLNKWTTVDIKGSNSWETRTFADNFYGIVSNFSNTGDPTEDWLVSPEIDFDFYDSERLTFMSQTAFNDGNILEVVVLTNYTGDPGAATITVLDPTLDPHRGGGFGNFTSSGSIDLGSVTGKGHVAFHFTAIDAADGTQWQVDDVEVSGVNPNGTADVFNLPFSEDFNECEDFGKPEAFTEVFISGSKTDRGWSCRDAVGTSNSVGVRANAFGGEAGEVNSWLVSAKQFNLTNASSATLEFDYRSQFEGNGDVIVQWSEDFDGNLTSATWNTLTDIPAQLPAKGSNSYVTVTSDLSAAAGKNVFVAFQFTGAQHDNSASFDIDNISVDATGGGGSGSTDAGDCDLSGSGTVIVTHDFETCSDFEIPVGFIEEFVTGSKTDRGWGCRPFGRDGGTGVQASAFGGEDGDDNAWLIMDPIDADAFGEISINFWMESFFSGPGEIKVLYSSDYSGSGDPQVGATWTELADVTAELPAGGSQVFTEVTTAPCDMSGSSVYIAFQYVGGSSSASSSWTLDDLTVTGN